MKRRLIRAAATAMTVTLFVQSLIPEIGHGAEADTTIAGGLPTRGESGPITGAVVGGIAGGIAGSAVGLRLAHITAVAADEDLDLSEASYYLVLFAGAALGALGGFQIGSAIGASVLGEDDANSGRAASDGTERKGPGPRRAGSLVIHPSYVSLSPSGVGLSGMGIRAGVVAHQASWFDLGPELSFHPNFPSLLTLGGSVRAWPGAKRVRPYAVANVGYYKWIGSGSVGAGAGAGLEWSTRSGSSTCGLETRYHTTIEEGTDGRRLSFVELGGRARFNW